LGKSSINCSPATKKPLVQSIDRALSILDLLADRGQAMRSSEIAAALELNPNTTHNIVRTLYRRGYLIQHEDMRYFLGPQCYHIGTLSDLWDTLRQIAIPIMQRLAKQTGDNAFLGVNAGDELVCVARLEGMGPIVVAQSPESLQQFHSTAAGKVLLAYHHPSLLKYHRGLARLERFTPTTITRWDRLLEELRLTRQRGYSLCRDEQAQDIASVGVPVLDSQGRILAALAQSFPSYYLDSERIPLPHRLELLRHSATRIAERYERRPSRLRKTSDTAQKPMDARNNGSSEFSVCQARPIRSGKIGKESR